MQPPKASVVNDPYKSAPGKLANGRSVKYEEVYLRAYDSVSEARASIGRYLNFYNGRRPHSSLDGMTPDQAYFSPLPLRLAA
jgi:transposase InsO family protein